MATQTQTRRVLWFVGIWSASVALTVLGAAALKWLFGRMLA